MIKIIKKGSMRKHKCESCGCEFTYEDEDVKPLEEEMAAKFAGYPQRLYGLHCPQCNARITMQPVDAAVMR